MQNRVYIPLVSAPCQQLANGGSQQGITSNQEDNGSITSAILHSTRPCFFAWMLVWLPIFPEHEKQVQYTENIAYKPPCNGISHVAASVLLPIPTHVPPVRCQYWEISTGIFVTHPLSSFICVSIAQTAEHSKAQIEMKSDHNERWYQKEAGQYKKYGHSHLKSYTRTKQDQT